MTPFILRNLQAKDLTAIVQLQQKYSRLYPDAPVIPGEVYLSPSYLEGQNLLLAEGEAGQILAYAPVYPVLISDPASAEPHTIWTEIKADPELADPYPVKSALLAAVKDRCSQILGVPRHRKAQLTFQYYLSEAPAAEFVCRQGATHTESIFSMARDLHQPLPGLPAPAGVLVRRWRMESEAEQAAYIAARNRAFPEAPTALADWQYFLLSPHWSVGTTISAFRGDELVGSVAVYWDPAEVAQSERKGGYTEYIFTLPEWRKRGIATYLIHEALGYLCEAGLDEARLEVRARNAGALGLYESLGYGVVKESRLYVIEL